MRFRLAGPGGAESPDTSEPSSRAPEPPRRLRGPKGSVREGKPALRPFPASRPEAAALSGWGGAGGFTTCPGR